MANKISIQFAARGHTGVTAAVKALNQQINKLAVANSLLSGTTNKLSAEQQILATQFLKTAAAAKTSSSSFTLLNGRMMSIVTTTALVGGGLLKITSIAGDVQEQVNKARVVFGGSFSEMQKWSEEFGDSVNRSRHKLLNMASGVQDILVPMGMARGEAAQLSKGITELAVDVGSFSNVASTDVMRDFNSALVGNHETVRKYGIVISETRMKQVALDEGIIEAGETLTDQQKIMARMLILQQDSSDAIGDATRTSDSYSNTMQGLKDTFYDTAVVWGEILLPVVKAFAQVLTWALQLMQRPSVIVAFAIAIGMLARKFIFTNIALVTFKKRVIAAGVAIKAFKASLGIIGLAMLAIEALWSLWDSGADKGPSNVEQAAKRAEKRMKLFKAEVEEMDIGTITTNYNHAKAKLEEYENKLAKAEKTLSDFQKGVDDGTITVKDFGGDLNEMNKHMRILVQGNVMAEVAVKNMTETVDIYDQKLNEAGLSTESIAKSQGNLITKLVQVKQDLELTTHALEKEGNALSESVASSEMAAWAKEKHGMTLEELAKKYPVLIDAYNDLKEAEDELAIDSLTLKYQDRIAVIEGRTKAEQEILKLQREGVELTEEEIEKITNLIQKEEELKKAKGLSKRISGLQTDITGLEAEIKDPTKEDKRESATTLEELKKASADMVAEFAKRHQTFLDMEKAHKDKLASLKDGEVWVGEAESMAEMLEYKKTLLEEELDFVKDNEAKKEEIKQDAFDKDQEREAKKAELKQLAMDMAFETASAVTGHLQSELDSQLKSEMDQLKNSLAYQKASDKQKEAMEKQVKEKYQKRQTAIFRLEQAQRLASVVMSTADAIMKVQEQWGWPAGIPLAGLMAAMGATQAGVIMAQKPPKLAKGGFIGGKLHSQGGTMIEAERGEFVMSRSATESIGLETLNQMNRTGNAGGSVVVSVQGNVMTQDFVEGELAESIKEAVRRGSDFGVS